MHKHTTTTTRLGAAAKRRKNEKQEDDNAWYEQIDQDATPDDVFWSEMERRKAIAGMVPSSSSSSSSLNTSNELEDPFVTMTASSMGVGSAGSGMGIGGMGSSMGAAVGGIGGGGGGKGLSSGVMNMPMNEERATEKTLALYAPFMVSDNWLNEEYSQMMGLEDFDLEEQDAEIDKQFENWEKGGVAGGGSDDNTDMEFGRDAYARRTEPWDSWGEEDKDGDGNGDDTDMRRIQLDAKRKAKLEQAKEFLLDATNTQIDTQQQEEEEAKYLQTLSEIRLKCTSLDKANGNPKAKAFFSRSPNEIEGFDRLWVSAIDDACFRNLAGNFRNYGVEFACNFGEWEDGCDADAFQSIEDIASYKARKVYEVTGLPTIASRTSFEVEPARVPDRSTPMNRMLQNTRVTSGYRFNDVGDHVDYIVEALKPYSEPTRVTRFRSCFCFYDGEIEVFEYGELDCDIYFSNSVRTFIPMNCGIDGLSKTLQLTFGLEFQGWLRKKVRDAMHGNESRVSMQLRDRILKEGKVLPNNIVDVSAFMDSMVDVNLMDDCGKELSKRFEVLKPTKILTIATTGLVLAIPMAKYLQVPVVYARKERNIVMSDTYKANYSSKTVGKNRELMVSKKHIHPDDRILIVDDFLSSGASQEALLRIVSDSGASAVGVGVLLEKVYDAGRQSLSGFNIPVESIAKIASVKDGIITMEEEEGYISSSTS